MLKLLCAFALAGVLMAQTAQAAPCCCNGHSAPAVTAAHPSAPAVAQAQQPQSGRSYSYQPAVNSAPTYRPLYRGALGAMGLRSADSKARGSY